MARSGTVRVRLPRALLQYWSGPASIDVEGTNLKDALSHIEGYSEGLLSRILDDQGRIRRHVAVFLNGTLLNSKDPDSVALRPGDEVHIVPAVSGG
jgi:sulfur-carrier protein